MQDKTNCLLGDGNGEHGEKRLFAKADIEAVKKSFCSLIAETKTCSFIMSTPERLKIRRNKQ